MQFLWVGARLSPHWRRKRLPEESSNEPLPRPASCLNDRRFKRVLLFHRRRPCRDFVAIGDGAQVTDDPFIPKRGTSCHLDPRRTSLRLLTIRNDPDRFESHVDDPKQQASSYLTRHEPVTTRQLIACTELERRDGLRMHGGVGDRLDTPSLLIGRRVSTKRLVAAGQTETAGSCHRPACHFGTMMLRICAGR